MVAGYAQKGRVDDIHHLFDNMLERNVVSWIAMIAGYCDNDKAEEAIHLFDKMQNPDVSSQGIHLTPCAQYTSKRW
jgi:pentatricopeptide repeat protein